jgi:AcrR family transcriptional regulator
MTHVPQQPSRTSPPAPRSDGDSKSARTRRRILDAAADILSTKGYAGTRLADVAALAEVQAPAIYYYFDSRDALVEEVMWAGIAEMREEVLRAVEAAPAGTSPTDRLMIALETHLRHALQISHYTTASIRNAGQVPDAIRQRQLTEEQNYGQVWHSLIMDAVTAGELRPDLDPYHARMLVLGALNWTPEWFNSTRDSVDSLVKSAKSLVRHGLEAR